MQTRQFCCAAAAACIALSGFGQAQLGADAGLDFAHDLASPAQLAGSASGRRTADFWLGDGDFANEDRFVCYSDALGLSQSGVLVETTTQLSAGWPSDVVEIGGTFYGVETGNRMLWKLTDFALGTVEQIGSQHSWPWVTCMAYDSVNDILYAVDGNQKRLLTIDRSTGQFTAIGAYLSASAPYYFIKGLAFDESSGLLFAIEDNTETLFTIDPQNNAQTNYVMDVPSGSNLYDELQFYKGNLYASYKYWDAPNGWWTATVRRIDYLNDTVYDVGPKIDQMSPHTLLIRSFPEEIEWTQLSGPAAASFSAPHELDSQVSFSVPGSYVLQLEVFGTTSVTDSVQVEVYELDCNANLVDDSLDIQNASSADMDGNGVPDECELLVYCSAKTNSLGCVPQVGFSGSPSLSDPNPFEVQASNVLNQRNGLLFYGYNSFALPGFQGGTLCVLPPLRRLPIQLSGGTLPPTSDCSGMYAFDFNAHAQSGLDPFLLAGTKVNAQWWSRDPGMADGAGLTDGLQFYLQN